MSDLQAGPMIPERVVGVRFNKVGKLYHFEFGEYPDLQPGDFVIVETQRGRQMGQIMGFAPGEADREYRSIMRPATPRDMALRRDWEARQDEALAFCQQKARELGGFEEAKFVAAQYNYDGSMLTFMFSAEEKIDVSRLHRILQKQFSAQLELRQIGPRDVAKLLGGYGACGAERCCSTFLTDFSPISIKMAKAQGISLNPSEITGMCGRLRCCLVYEYEQYIEARKQLPKRNKRVGTPFGEGKIVDVHPLRDAVTVYIEDVGLRMVEREDIVPLDELKALARAAKEPCSKHGDGPCDCGRPAGQRRADSNASPTQSVEVDDEESDVTQAGQAESDVSETGEKRQRRGQRRRGGRRRNTGKRE